MSITIIGDVHGKFDKYIELTKQYPYTVQLGDMGFNYSKLYSLDHNYHRFFKGNHDNHDIQDENNPPCWLGEYGNIRLNNVNFFYISGAWSIDHKQRQKYEPLWGKTWWENEELSYDTLNKAIDLYTKCQPQIMLSHECPQEVVRYVTNPEVTRDFGYSGQVIRTRTNQALQACFDVWQPKVWVFGHFHTKFHRKINNTDFVCLPELDVLTIY